MGYSRGPVAKENRGRGEASCCLSLPVVRLQSSWSALQRQLMKAELLVEAVLRLFIIQLAVQFPVPTHWFFSKTHV